MVKKKKPSPIPGIIYIVCVVAAFIYLPNLVAFLIAFGGFGTLLIAGEIVKQLQMIRLRNQTNKSTIASAPEGFAEIIGKVKNPAEVRTFLTNEPADYRSITFSYVQKGNRERDLNANTIFSSETEEKRLQIYDGSADCQVLLHASKLDLPEKVIHIKTEEIRQLLKENPLDDFPLKVLDEHKILTVTEKWVRKGEKLRCYGYMRKLISGERPQEVIAAHEKEIRGLDFSRRNFTESDWQELELETGSSFKIMTSHYVDLARRDVRELIISNKDDKQLNRRAYFQILFMVLIFLFLIGLCIGITWSQYPELFNHISQMQSA